MAPVPGRQLDGFAVKKNAEASDNLLNAESPPVLLVRGRLRPPKSFRLAYYFVSKIVSVIIPLDKKQ